MTGQGGQSSVEVVALVPVLAAVALALMQVLAAGAAAEYAGHAAEAGAVAVVQGGDPTEAARKALPAWSARRVAVEVSGQKVAVRVEPPVVLPALGRLLVASAEADAGPAPAS